MFQVLYDFKVSFLFIYDDFWLSAIMQNNKINLSFFGKKLKI